MKNFSGVASKGMDALMSGALASGVPLASKNQRDYRFIAELALLPYPYQQKRT